MAVALETEPGSNGSTPEGRNSSIVSVLTQEMQDIKKQEVEVPFLEYLPFVENLLKIGSTTPFDNAAATLVRAIESKDITTDELGRNHYSFLEGRKDKLRVIGNNTTVENIIKVLKAHAERLGPADRMILLVAASGAGKSLAVSALKQGLEEYTKEGETALYGVVGCKIQENPLNLLPPKTKQTLKDKYGVSVGCPPCPDCQKRLEDAQYDLSGFKVRKLRLDKTVGRGITKIDPPMEGRVAPHIEERVQQAMLQSNRGIAHVGEFATHPAIFIRALKDLVRDRTIERREGTYTLDNIILADTTYDEFKKLMDTNPDIRTFVLQRVDVVMFPYGTSFIEEADIYEKFRSENRTKGHVTRKTLEVFSKIATASRIKLDAVSGLSNNQAVYAKMEMYAGIENEFFPQTKRSEYEQKGREADEAMDGISAPFMWGELSQILAQHPECLDPLSAIVELEHRIEKSPKKSPLKDADRDLKEFVEYARIAYEAILAEEVLEAFRNDFEEKYWDDYRKYIDDATLFLDKADRYDPIEKKKMPVTDDFLREVEDKIEVVDSKAPLGKRGLTDEERENLRLEASRSRPIKHGEEIRYEKIPLLDQGIDKGLKGLSESAEKTLLAILGTPTKRQEERLQEVRGNLIENYDYCECCVDKLMKRAAELVKAKTPKGGSANSPALG